MIYGKPIWGTDWSLKKEYKSLTKAKEVAKEMAKASGVAHEIEQYKGFCISRKKIFQIWREIAPLNVFIPMNLKGRF